jgi:hypothetical protein
VKLLLCLIAVLAITAAAAEKPNFSGEWKMNASKSVLGPVPAPTSWTRKITHREPSLTIANEQKGGIGEQSYTRTYTTDGKEIAFQSDGTDVKGGATWDGDVLVIYSHADAGGTTISITEKMTLSGGSKMLTDAVHIVLPRGDIDVTYVFDKQ